MESPREGQRDGDGGKISSRHVGATMDAPSFSEFEAAARDEGFAEVVSRAWPGGAVVGTHEHPFAVKALVVAGEMWLTHDGKTQHLRPGDRFELGAGVPHDERYGAAGATYWAARRHPGR
jgi:quercetin dioxygenase-like cupin family protein